jgi:hypothetical protein
MEPLVLLLFVFFQLAFKCIKLIIPKLLVKMQPFACRSQHLPIKGAGMRPSRNLAVQKAGMLQHFNMLGSRPNRSLLMDNKLTVQAHLVR